MSYLRNSWYVAGHAEEAAQKLFVRTILDEPIVIFRTEDGQLTALGDRCPHRFAPMHKGKILGDSIQCPYHGLRFDRTGRCVAMPAGGEPPPRARLKAYPIVDRYGLLWIWMGDASRADAGTIPDFSRLELQDSEWWTGYLYVKANYRLIVDNLLDLSHVEFIHPMLASDGWAARNEQNIGQSGDTLTIHNVARGDPAAAMALQMNPKLSPVGTNVQILRWSLPSVLQLSIEYYSETGDWIVPSGHFLTPETATTTHYFLRGGQSVDPGNALMTAGMKAGTLYIFQTEDIAMIELQQKNIGTADLMDLQPAILRADSGAVRARRILSKKIREEAARYPDELRPDTAAGSAWEPAANAVDRP